MILPSFGLEATWPTGLFNDFLIYLALVTQQYYFLVMQGTEKLEDLKLSRTLFNYFYYMSFIVISRCFRVIFGVLCLS